MKPSKTIALGKFRSTMSSYVREIQEENTVYVVTRLPGKNHGEDPKPEFIAMSPDELLHELGAIN